MCANALFVTSTWPMYVSIDKKPIFLYSLNINKNGEIRKNMKNPPN